MKVKNVVFLGDSITEGSGASCIENCYVSLVASEKDFNNVYNFGIGGTRIARKLTPSRLHKMDLDFNLRTVLLPDEIDYIVVFGGTNDYGSGEAPLGVIGEETPFTFAGAVQLLVNRLIKKYGKEKVRFVLPLKRYNHSLPRGNKYVLKEYVDVLKQILEKENIPYLNLFENGLEEPTTDLPSEYFTDGLHPNDKGHEYLAKTIANFIREKE